MPDNIVSIDDRTDLFDTIKKLERTKKIAGFNTRYIAPPGCTAADLCESAAKRLMKDMNIGADEIEAVVFVVQNPDYPQPGSACVLHGKLNLSKNCAAFDVNHGCAGYIYGLWIASALIESRTCKKVLLLAGDSLQIEEQLNNKIVEPLFGNAGSATLLEYTEQENLSSYIINTDGSKFDVLITPAGGERLPVDKDILDMVIEDKNGNRWKLNTFFMDGLNVFEFTIAEVPANIKELMEYAGISDTDIDFYVLHQANKQIVDTIAGILNIPGDKYSTLTFSTYGNQSSVSLPGSIAHMLQEKVSGGVQKLLLSGFGIGLSWGSAYLQLDHIYCSGIIKEKFDTARSRQNEIEYWVNRIKGR